MANSAEWKVVPLAASVEQRYTDTSVDGLLTNGYLQKDAAGAIWVRRRAGLTQNTATPVGAGFGQAILSSAITGFGNFISYTNAIYENVTSVYSWGVTSGASWLNQSTVVNTYPLVYASNGNEGAYYNGTNFVKITNANYPPSTLNGSAFLNGYLYVLDPQGRVWGTPNQNDFSVWISTNVVNAWGTTGKPFAIRRYLNEVFVFKTYTTEVFYDSGNSVGSPLLPVQQINIKWGCSNPQTIVSIDEEMFWVGTSSTGINAVIRMNQFNPVVVSNEQINRLLSVNGASTTFNLFQVAAFSCEMGGNRFYCLNYIQLVNGVAYCLIFAYNLSSGEWSLFNTGLIPPFNGGNSYPIDSANDPGADQTNILFSTGNIYTLDDSVTVDTPLTGAKLPISMRLRTDNFEAGTSVGKMVSGLRIKADQKSASALRIRWSDDDYQTWSAWRSIDLSRPAPSLPGLQGTFSKRAYELEYAGSDPIRFSRLELLIALCDI